MSQRPSPSLSVAFGLALAVLGCEERKPPLPLAPAASSLAPSLAKPSSKVVRFVLDGRGPASVDMPAPKEHIKATVEGFAGTLELDPSELSRSRGEVRLDLTTLHTTTFADDKRNATQTAHALAWLEVADAEGAKLPDAVKAANRHATYAIRGVERASATDLAHVPVETDAEGELRRVSLSTKGELLVHGRKAPRDADLDVVLRYAKGAPAEQPSAVSIRTRQPLHVVLAEHDVKPRDATGQLAKEAFHLLGTKVADTADVTLELRGKPQP